METEADAYLGGEEDSTERSSLVRGKLNPTLAWPFPTTDFVLALMTRREYYSGVLFLTTNFPEKIDEAFSSRIDVHFEHPALDRASRCRLLKTMTEFTTSARAFAQPNELSEQDYWNLARFELNGRELQNAVKISSRLCSIKRETLMYRGMETAIRHTAPRKFMEPEAGVPQAKKRRLS